MCTVTDSTLDKPARPMGMVLGSVGWEGKNALNLSLSDLYSTHPAGTGAFLAPPPTNA